MTRVQQFKDIDLTFRRHPMTNEISTLKNDRAINQSLKNILRLVSGDLPFNNVKVPNIRSLLFEPIDSTVSATLEKRIHIAITQLEPRVNLRQVQTIPEANQNRYLVIVNYQIKNSTETVEFRDVLERVA